MELRSLLWLTLEKIVKKITTAIASSESPALANKKRCIIRLPKYDFVDEACWKWFCQQRSKGAPVYGVLLQEKARNFFPKLYPDADSQSFKGSMGWLTGLISIMALKMSSYEERFCLRIRQLWNLSVRN